MSEYHPARVIQGMCPECGQPTERPAVIEFGNLRLDRSALRVWISGESTQQFTPAEFEILWKIAGKRGAIMPHWFLQDDGATGERAAQTIKVLIHNLRKKLPDPELVQTIRGEGYRIKI